MKELSIEKMEVVNGGLRGSCAAAMVGLGLAAIALGSITGGLGFYAYVSMASVGFAGGQFMYSCGPSDFK